MRPVLSHLKAVMEVSPLQMEAWRRSSRQCSVRLVLGKALGGEDEGGRLTGVGGVLEVVVRGHVGVVVVFIEPFTQAFLRNLLLAFVGGLAERDEIGKGGLTMQWSSW